MEKAVTCLLEAKSGSARGMGWSCSTRTPLGQSCLQHPQMGVEAWKRQGLGKKKHCLVSWQLLLPGFWLVVSP